MIRPEQLAAQTLQELREISTGLVAPEISTGTLEDSFAQLRNVIGK